MVEQPTAGSTPAGPSLRGRVDRLRIDAALVSGQQLTVGTTAACRPDLTVSGLSDDTVFVGDVFDLPRGRLRVAGPAPGGYRAVVVQSGKVDEGNELVLSDVDEVGIAVADVRRILDVGAAAAGFSVERVLAARHLFPDEWIAVLPRPGEPSGNNAGRP